MYCTTLYTPCDTYVLLRLGRILVWCLEPDVVANLGLQGHTTATAFLFAKMGFDSFQFGRSPPNASTLLPTAPDGNQFVQ